MTDATRYTRWQGLALAQFSVAIGLISALAIAGLGTGLSLVQNQSFTCALTCKRTFVVSMVMLFISVGFSVFTVVTRTLDFRLTARVARNKTSATPRPETYWRMTSDTYGSVSWACFWISLAALVFGSAGLAVSIAIAYLVPLW